MLITCVNDTGDKLFSGVNDTGEKLSPVSLSPTINPCHGFSVIAGVIDTGDNFIAGDNDPGEQLSPLTTKGNKFIAGDQNKDAMEVGSCQR